MRQRAGWRALLAVAVLGVTAVSAGCGAGTGNGGSRASPTARPPVSASPATSRIRKILVIVEQNHDYDQVFPTGMPYLWRLARRYGYATRWHAVSQSSLQNFLAIFAGSTFGAPQDCDPGPACQFPGPTVFGQAITRGKTARSYLESMPQPCYQSDSGNYVVTHNPWAYFPAEAAQCQAWDLPAGTPSSGALASDARSGRLPAVGLLTPDRRHDGHNGTLAQADAWLHGWLPVLMSGPDWRAGRLAIVVVFDDGATGSHVPFVLIAPQASGAVVGTWADHYALTRLIGQVIGAPPLRRAAGAATVAPPLRLAPP